MIKADLILNNSSNTIPKSRVIGIKTRNKIEVLFGLTIVLSFSYLYIISGIQTTWAATLEETIAVGEGPIALAFNPSNDNLYVANFKDGNVSIIDTSSNTVEETIAVGEGPIALAFNPSNDNLYVATETSGNVSVIEPWL